jgi:hypothetical protein
MKKGYERVAPVRTIRILCHVTAMLENELDIEVVGREWLKALHLKGRQYDRKTESQ